MRVLFKNFLFILFVLYSFSAQAAETVKVAVIFAKTGDAAPVSIMAFTSARFAADEINRQGGFMGKKIELIEIDNKSTPLGSMQAAKKAVKENVHAVIGAARSSNSLAMATVLQEAKTLMISPSSTNPKVTLTGNYIFRICFTDLFQGKVMADFALNHLKAKTAVVLTNSNNEYSIGLARFFIEHFKPEGKILMEGDYLEDTADFQLLLEKVKTLKPNVIFVPGYHRDSAFIIKQARKMGIMSTFLGGDGWHKRMYEYAGDYLHGNYYSHNWHFDSPNELSQAFVKKFASMHGKFRSGMIALTYDAVNVFADAVRRANSTKPDRIREAFSATKDYKGVTGNITFDKNGDPIKSAVIMKFENNDTVFYKIVDP